MRRVLKLLRIWNASVKGQFYRILIFEFPIDETHCRAPDNHQKLLQESKRMTLDREGNWDRVTPLPAVEGQMRKNNTNNN